MYEERQARNSKFISTPTLLIALASAHVAQALTAPFDLGPVFATLAYLAGLAAPVVFKWLLSEDNLFESPSELDTSVSRLPFSRYPTVPGRPSLYPKGPLAHMNR